VRLLRRNLLMVYGVYAASIVSGLVTIPIVVHSLGKTQYGLWAFVLGLTEYLNLLDLGVSPSIVRYGAKYRGEQAHEETNALASVGLVVYGAIGVLTLVAGLVLVAVIPYLIDLPAALDGRARIVVALVALGFVIQFPLGLFGSLLAAQQRYDVINLAGLISIPLYVALVAVVLPRSHDVVWLGLIVLATALVRLVLPLFWVRRELPFLRPRRALVSRARIRELTRFSVDNFVMHISAKVVFTSDVVVIGIVLGPRQAAIYAIPAKLFSTAFGIGTAGQRLMLPAFSEFEGAADRLRQRLYLRSGIRLGMAAMLLLALPLLLIPGHVIRAWVGFTYVSGRTSLAVLAVVLLVIQPTQVLGQYLLARGRQRRIAGLLVGKVIANLALSVVLAKAVGIWGVAAGTLVTELALVALLPRFVLSPDDPSWRDLLRSWMRPVAPAFAVAVPLFLGAAAVYDPGTLATIAPLGIAWVVLAAPALWRFGLTREERSALAWKLRGRDDETTLVEMEGGVAEVMASER
jgi:O-antigen/teichoic acid export membrane protein